MTRRRNIWERLNESTEGPTVTISIPREWAEQLMASLMASLEIEDDMGEDDLDDEGDLGMDPDGDDEDDGIPAGFSAGDDDEPDFAAGDDDEEDSDDAGDEPHRGPGRPPGSKNKKSDDDDDDDDDEKDEAVDFSDSDRPTRPKTALGESAFSQLSRKLAGTRTVRKNARGRRR